MIFPDPNVGYHFGYGSRINENGILVTFLGGKVKIPFLFKDIAYVTKEAYAGGVISWDVIRWGKCPKGTQALKIVLKKGNFIKHLVIFEDLDGAVSLLKDKVEILA